MSTQTNSYSLSEFSQLIKRVLSRELGGDYWVIAEIGDMKTHSSGHCYLELLEKENERIKAKLRATIWANTFYQLAPWFERETGEKLKNGMKVLCNLRINFHEVYGLSLTINQIDPSFTLGERARKRKEILERLERENVLGLNKILPLPLVPNRIAVISSAQAAGYEDFVKQIASNSFRYHLDVKLFSAIMQGDNSVSSIMDAFKSVHKELQNFDTIVLIRGGGSQLDLDTFDSYDLALTIAHSKLPVITGIGHERDETIADLVANTRVKTPTAAAEFLIASIADFEESMQSAFEKIKSVSINRIYQSSSQLDKYHSRLELLATRLAERSRNRLKEIESGLRFGINNRIAKSSHQLSLLAAQLEQHNPQKILEKGYTITLIDGKSLNQFKTIEEGQELLTLSNNYKIESTVTKVNKENEN